MCIVDQVPLSAFTKSTRLQAQKWGQPWDFLTRDSKWSSNQASYSSSMETSSDVTRDSGTTTHPHGSTKLVDSLQELGGLPNRQDGLGDLSEEWSATSLDSLDVWRLKVKRIWMDLDCEKLWIYPFLNLFDLFVCLGVDSLINLFLNWSHCPLDIDRFILWFLHVSIQANSCIHTRMLWSPLGCFTYSACTDASLHSCIMQSGKVSIASHIFWSKDLFCINSCLPISMFDHKLLFPTCELLQLQKQRSSYCALQVFFLAWECADSWCLQAAWTRHIDTKASHEESLWRMTTYERVNLTEVRLGDLDKKGRGESQSRASSMTLHPGPSAARR